MIKAYIVQGTWGREHGISDEEIIPNNITGKYKFENDTMYIEIKRELTWIQRLCGCDPCYYVSENNIIFKKVEYFNCKN